jgi:hypothetical protein
MQSGALGHEKVTSANVDLPTLLESLTNQQFVQLAAGQHHMGGITNEGQLYETTFLLT